MSDQIFYPDEIVPQTQAQMDQLSNQNLQLSSALQSSFQAGGLLNENLIQYQLEADQLHADIRHFLSGDEEVMDEVGNIKWVVQKDPEKRPLNELGVSEFMRTITSYIGKQTYLSAYTEERIYEILSDLGQQLRIMLISNYENFGMNTPHKQSKFILIVLTPLHLIESAYRRAIGGRERDNIREGRIVTQNQQMGQGGAYGGNSQTKKRFNLFNTSTW